MKTLIFQTLFFLTVLFCVNYVSAQSGWVSSQKTDGIEVFYRFEKSGSRTLEVEVKVTNRRAKPIDVVIKITTGDADSSSNSGIIRLSPTPTRYTKLTVKANESSINKVEIDGLEVGNVEIYCWQNIDSQKKCDLPSRRISPPRGDL